MPGGILTKSFQPMTMAGSASFYHEQNLRFYDFCVLGFNSRFVWRCPSTVLETHFAEYVTADHCDIGVGTGYFLNQMRKRGKLGQCHLIDANPACLHWVAKRLTGIKISSQCSDILEPIQPIVHPVQSISINYLIHCLSGPIARKENLFDNLRRIGQEGCIVFGSTVIGEGVGHSLLARFLLPRLNRNGMFDTSSDDLLGIMDMVNRNLINVVFRIVGSVLLFSGRLFKHCAVGDGMGHCRQGELE